MFWRNKRTYLDYAAGVGGNPSSPHYEGRLAKKMLEDARRDIARLLEVQSDDVIFTSGATEANALAILGVAKSGDHVLYLPSSHASIVENMKLLAERGVEVEPLPITDWRVDCEKLKKILKPNTKLVSMDAVCGETGTIWNTREVAQVLREHSGKGLFSLARGTAATREKNTFSAVLHVDASQAPLTEKITRAHFGADMLTLDASKVGSVRGIGALIAHRTIPLKPLYRGGGQERGLRSGSEAPELAEKFAAALGTAAYNRESFRVSAKHMRTRLINEITNAIKNICVNESRTQVPHILNLSLTGRDTDYLIALLDESGFAVSTRSACETDSEEGSRAVLVLTGDVERAKSTLRISWGPNIRESEFTHFAKALVLAVSFIDNE
ncbi:MAG: aminotransferase class V-fold PLP-dependent enzyme [bacterium]|nr:aminotransferase class V-fold PLP-dependent enzyme [bacterium]